MRQKFHFTIAIHSQTVLHPTHKMRTQNPFSQTNSIEKTKKNKKKKNKSISSIFSISTQANKTTSMTLKNKDKKQAKPIWTAENTTVWLQGKRGGNERKRHILNFHVAFVQNKTSQQGPNRSFCEAKNLNFHFSTVSQQPNGGRGWEGLPGKKLWKVFSRKMRVWAQ